MKKLVVFCLLCLLLANCRLQSQPNTWDWVQDSLIEITYHLPEAVPGQTYNVSVYLSCDTGKTFTKTPLTLVAGDVGKGIRPGKNKKIIWKVLVEIPDLRVGILIFDVRTVAEVRDDKTETIREKKQKHLFIGYKGSFTFNSFTAPIGFTIGFLGNPGLYLAGRLNPNYFMKSSYEIENGMCTTSGWILYEPDDYKIKRFSMIFGILPQIGKKLYINAGLGFTQYQYLTQILQDNTNAKEWAKDLDESFASYELEVGLLYQPGKIFIGAGVSNYNKDCADITISLGVVF